MPSISVFWLFGLLTGMTGNARTIWNFLPRPPVLLKNSFCECQTDDVFTCPLRVKTLLLLKIWRASDKIYFHTSMSQGNSIKSEANHFFSTQFSFFASKTGTTVGMAEVCWTFDDLWCQFTDLHIILHSLLDTPLLIFPLLLPKMCVLICETSEAKIDHFWCNWL